MKTQFRTNYNGLQAKHRYEIVGGESQTVQGEAYTIPELMARAASQGLILNNEDGLYIDQEIDKITSMYRNDLDMHDLKILKDHNTKLGEAIKAEIEQQNTDKQEEELLKKQEEKADKDYAQQQAQLQLKVDKTAKTD